MRNNLFYLMAKLPPEIMALVAGMARTQVDASRLHITLAHLGLLAGLPRDVMLWLLRVLGAIDAPPFRVVFDQLVESEKSVLLAGSNRMDGAISAQRQIVRALRAKGVPIFGPDPFRPHVTINYGTDGRGSGPILPISWQVQEFMLIESGNGRHIEHGRWPLRTTAMAA